MKHRVLAIFLTAMMVLSVMAACGQASPGSSAAQSSAGSAVAPSGDSAPVELSLWHMEEPPNRVKRFNEVFDRFNAENPGIKVTANVQTWGDAYTKFPAAIMAGNGPDLLHTAPDHCTIIYEIGAVEPVTDIINKINSQQKYMEAATSPYKYGDDYYAIPTYGMVQVLWYRKDMFAAAGLEAPKTWDDLLAAAEKLTSGDVYGIALPASLSMATDQVIYTLMAGGGSKDMVSGDDKVFFDNPQTVAAYDLYQKLLQFSPPDSSTYQWGEPQALLNSGKVAMAIEKGQYLAPFTAESGHPAEDLGCVQMPTATGGDHASFYSPEALMLLAKDENKKAAASTFLEWLFQPETYGSYINAEPGLFLPVTETGSTAKSFTEDPVIAQYPDQVKTLVDASVNGCMAGFTDGISMKVGKIYGPNLLAAVLQQIVANDKSPAEAVAWGQVEMDKAINN